VNIALVASEFNAPIPEKMLAAAREKADALGVKVVAVVRVPGSWEIPLAVKAIVGRRDVDAVVAIGALVQGETRHDELIGDAVARALMDLMLANRKPIGLGITGPGMTWEQAEDRVENAVRAVDAAVRMARDGLPRPRQNAKHRNPP